MAAGLGFKTFTTGEVLTAADTNGYLMQGINVFASSAARAAAITSPQEGQYSYLKDTNALEYYDGAAWVGAPVGDITAVTAGKGLTGGGSSGDVTVSLGTTAKGDLVAGSGASTAAVLTVGNNGETLVADSSTSTGLRYQGSQAAGKNILINGGFDIWQRGTSSASTGYTTADRWYMNAASTTFSQETTTVPTGVRYALKALTSGTTTVQFRQAVETLNAIQFAGKTVVLSGEYQASTTTTIQTKLFYSTSVDNSVTGSWTEITATTGGTVSAVSGSYTKSSSVFAVPSTAKSLMLLFDTGSVASAVSLYYGKIQLELGSVATEFERAGGTIQGELAACQRYYYRINSSTGFASIGLGQAYSTTAASVSVPFPVQMRVVPTVLDTTGTAANYVLTTAAFGTGSNSILPTQFNATTQSAMITATVASGLVAGNATHFTFDGTSKYLGFGAEL